MCQKVVAKVPPGCELKDELSLLVQRKPEKLECFFLSIHLCDTYPLFIWHTEASLYYVAHFTLCCFFVIVHNGMRTYAKEDDISLIRKATNYEGTRFNSL